LHPQPPIKYETKLKLDKEVGGGFTVMKYFKTYFRKHFRRYFNMYFKRYFKMQFKR